MNGKWIDGEKSIRSLCGTFIALSVQLGERYHLWSQNMYLVGEITGPNKRARHSLLCTLNKSVRLTVIQFTIINSTWLITHKSQETWTRLFLGSWVESIVKVIKRLVVFTFNVSALEAVVTLHPRRGFSSITFFSLGGKWPAECTYNCDYNSNFH